MKQCTKCKKIKELHQFSKDRSRKDGLQLHCKQCLSDYLKANKEKVLIVKRAYAIKKRVKIAEYMVHYNAVNYERDGEKIRARTSRWKSEHKKEVAIQKLNWRLANPGKYAAYCAKRRAKKLKATPLCLNEEYHRQNEEFYIVAHELQWLSEESLHVDHIIPLQGENVSGLHVPWNLQILPKSLNGSKGNEFDQIEHDRLNLPLLIEKLSQNS